MGIFGFFNKNKKEVLDNGLEKTKHSVFDKISRAVMGKSTVDDEVLEKRVRYEIGEVIGHEKHHVVVTSYEGKVLLTGEVLTAADRQKAQDTAVKSVGVHSVINELA